MTADRHSRSRLAGYDPDKLFAATALVVGAGALGQNLLLDLALTGLGRLIVVDHDEFEDHNVTRSPYFPTAESSGDSASARPRRWPTRSSPI